ncbi:hypothetical protein O1Q96_23250 [Streptomyces sp. Qhu-G9]|uniref:hypothetical protein n=1 Tax=Streptomyces sp. Qhu-G9 TaxID=3452799 RepID=UPI0022AC611C|nr:hypothetical protein [Streptomyces aurantiacus]WAU86675.1 hypothetical protein O1Q96_23250 [Streptomyces aurantiacus]
MQDFVLHDGRAFTGVFDGCRNIERYNELLAPFRGLGIDGPALYVVGARDLVTALRPPDRGTSLSEISVARAGRATR